MSKGEQRGGEEPGSSRPPEAPEHERRIRIPPIQWIGMPIILLLPILALAGVFGDTVENATELAGAIEVRVEYPSRFRYRMSKSIALEVRNRSPSPLDTVRVSIDPRYMMQFSSVVFTPSVDRAFEVSLEDVGPGESRLVIVEFQGERYGRHEGQLVASSGADTVARPIQTTVLP